MFGKTALITDRKDFEWRETGAGGPHRAVIVDEESQQIRA